jgi:azurin/DNA-binding transcriptional ArsR family regulator
MTSRGRVAHTSTGVAFLAAAIAALLPGSLWAWSGDHQPPPPKIILDAAPRAVEYQLARLTNDELVRLERKEGDPRYRLVYYALLTRKGLGREYFNEALAALTALDKATPAQVLLEALSKVRADDQETGDKLLSVLLAQPADALRKERAQFAAAAESATSPFVLRAAYAGLMTADGSPQQAWASAAKRDGHLLELLRAVPQLPGAELRGALADPIARLLAETQDAPARAAALAALAAARPDAATFGLLAREVVEGSDADLRASAIGALQRIPKEAWPQGDVEPLARAIVAMVGKAPPAGRTEPLMADAIQLGEKLADGLSGEAARAVRRDLRALGVQIVRIGTIPEQMTFDLKWFAVQAGKPVQIVLYNPDAMSHNLLVTKPGSLKEVGMAATTMTLPADPKVKPYVPDSPLVLHATRLLNWGETERLGFTAPAAPGEYPFVCTFPGHWVRMYGVMLVVENLEAWEAKPTVPADPMTGQPFASQRD